MSNKNYFHTLALIVSVAGTMLWAGTAAAVTIAPGGAGTVGTLAVGGANIRFVEVLRTTFGLSDSNVLAIAEMEAFTFGDSFGTPNTDGVPVVINTNDLALSAAAGGSATVNVINGAFSHGATDNLISGLRNTGGNTFQRSVVSGEVRVRVDLGATENVGTIRLWQRADGCCQGRLAEFTLNAYEDNGFGAPGALAYTQYTPGVVTPVSGVATFNIPDIAIIETGDVLSIDLDGFANTSDTYKVGATGLGDLTIQAGVTLELKFVGPYQGFVAGQTYDLLDFGSLSGTFDNIVAPNGVIFDFGNLYTTGQITVLAVLAPEPTSLGLMSIGCVLLMSRRRRQRN